MARDYSRRMVCLKEVEASHARISKKAQLIGNVMQAGEGLEFVLSKRKTYYFVCGEKQGFHCSTGSGGFFIRPAKRC